jgi:hypothetical protein
MGENQDNPLILLIMVLNLDLLDSLDGHDFRPGEEIKGIR